MENIVEPKVAAKKYDWKKYVKFIQCEYCNCQVLKNHYNCLHAKTEKHQRNVRLKEQKDQKLEEYKQNVIREFCEQLYQQQNTKVQVQNN